MSRIRSSLALLVGCVWALGLAGTALAADMAMPVKAPPPPPPPPSWWSAFIEVVYENGQVNPQGQAVYKEGDVQIIAGANLALYKDKTGFINNVSVGGLVIFDFIANGSFGPADSVWAAINPAGDDADFYHILAADASVTFGQYWTLTDTFFHLSGANANGNFVANPATPAGTLCFNAVAGAPLGCEVLPAWYWNELKLSLNDGAITHWPISFNPYVTWYYELYPSGPAGVLTTGTSAACFSCNFQNSDFIIGMTPKVNIQPYIGLPITLTVPTWFTVGPTSFWGQTIGTGFSNSNIGVFSTGLTASLAMTWVPAQYGHWSLKAGVQYYDIVNKALQIDNTVTYGASFGLQQNIVTGFVGVGVGF